MNLFKSVFSLAILLTSWSVMAADDFVPFDLENDITGTSSLDFTIDSSDVGGDLELQFGTTLAEFLRWDAGLGDFVLSDTLRVGGNIDITENQITFDVDNVAAGADVRILANQGSDLPGEIRYNATTNQWEYSNDGGAFEAIGSGGAPVVSQDLPIVQARISTVLAIPTTFTDVSFDVTDIENNTLVLDHDNTLRDRVLVLEDGLYFISYDFSIDYPIANNSFVNIFSQVRVNDGTILNGSQSQTSAEERDFDGSELSQSFVANLTAGDFLSLQLQRTATDVNTIANGIFVVYKLEATVAPLGNGTDAEVFILDNDDTGGSLSFQFGTTLNETLLWDDSNSRFALSDDLRVEGNLATVGQGYVAGDHTAADSDGVLNLGRNGSSWETFIFDATTDDRFELSDDLEVQGNLEVTGDINSPCGPSGIFWAERGAVNSNQSWAMGNGQTPWGSPMGCAGRVTRFAATCTGSIGTSLDAVVRVNNVVTPCSLNLSTTVGQATTVSCNQAFGPNDVVGVYAGTEVGAWTNCVGTFWVRYD